MRRHVPFSLSQKQSAPAAVPTAAPPTASHAPLLAAALGQEKYGESSSGVQQLSPPRSGQSALGLVAAEEETRLAAGCAAQMHAYEWRYGRAAAECKCATRRSSVAHAAPAAAAARRTIGSARSEPVIGGESWEVAGRHPGGAGLPEEDEDEEETEVVAGVAADEEEPVEADDEEEEDDDDDDMSEGVVLDWGASNPLLAGPRSSARGPLCPVAQMLRQVLCSLALPAYSCVTTPATPMSGLWRRAPRPTRARRRSRRPTSLLRRQPTIFPARHPPAMKCCTKLTRKWYMPASGACRSTQAGCDACW